MIKEESLTEKDIQEQRYIAQTEHNFNLRHKIRVLFVLRYRDNIYKCDPCTTDGDGTYSYGHLSSGLYNSARLVCEMLGREGFHTKLVQVVDNNAIHREIVHFKADIVIIEAYWVIPPKFDVLRDACPNVKFVIRNHSDLAFLSNEGNAVTWTMEYLTKKNVWMSCNSIKTVEEIRFLASAAHPHWTNAQVNRKVPYLPNFYPTDTALPPKHAEISNVVNIGCFGAIRPLKNQLIQAVAALKYASDREVMLHFHINGTRIEGHADPILKNLIGLFSMYPHAHLFTHDWLTHKDFLLLIRKMDAVMQVSFSETFNIVAADAVCCGVPIVVSQEVPWAPSVFQASVSDVDDIVEKLKFAIEFPRHFPHVRNPSLDGLDTYDARSIKAWTSFLSNLYTGLAGV